MTEAEYLESISERSSASYPAVVRIADPLLIRFNTQSLLVNDTNFYVKIKRGLAFVGFDIYTSGLGTPIAEIQLSSGYKQSSPNNIIQSKEWSLSDLEKEASKFLDILEARIAISESDNEIRKAIDRLCWQLHFDITKTDSDLPEGFYTETIIDKSAKTFDDYTTKITTDLSNIKTELEDFNDYFTDDVDGYKIICSTLNNSIVDVGNKISSDVDATLSSAMNKVAINLRADEDESSDYQEYTISRALRDGSSEQSVSGATYQQTQLEQQHFNEVSINQLGEFGSTYNNHRSLYSTVGSFADSPQNSTLSNELSKIGSSADGNASTNTGTLFYEILHRAGTRSLNGAQIQSDSPVDVIMDKVSDSIGSASTSGTLWYDVIHNAGTGTPGATVSTSSIAGLIESLSDNIGDGDTSSTLWYDVLHNSGTQLPTATVQNNSVVSYVQRIGSIDPANNWQVFDYLKNIYNAVS